MVFSRMQRALNCLWYIVWQWTHSLIPARLRWRFSLHAPYIHILHGGVLLLQHLFGHKKSDFEILIFSHLSNERNSSLFRLHRGGKTTHFVTGFIIIPLQESLLLMEEILHHLGCIIPCKQLDIYHINWCRISEPSTVLTSPFCTTESHSRGTEKTPKLNPGDGRCTPCLGMCLTESLGIVEGSFGSACLGFFHKKNGMMSMFSYMEG